MKPSVVLLLAGFLLLTLSAARSAAQPMLMSPDGGASPVTLTPLDGRNPFPPVGTAPVTGNVFIADVGFNYIQPLRAGTNLTLRVPNGSSPAASIIGATGDLADSFTFVPRLDARYYLNEWGMGAAASAEFIALNGSLSRTIITNVGSADLSANSNLTIFAMNLPELVVSSVLGDRFEEGCFPEHSHLAETVVDFTLGTRFAWIQQNYDAQLISGGNLSSATGEQDFAGFGLTSSVGASYPLTETLSLYANVRGSVLLGQNHRKSAVSTASPGNAAASFSNSLNENKTMLLPVGECEVGIQCFTPMNQGADAASGTLFMMRAGLVGQIWGGADFLPASDQRVGFTNHSLYLVGFALMAGILH